MRYTLFLLVLTFSIGCDVDVNQGKAFNGKVVQQEDEAEIRAVEKKQVESPKVESPKDAEKCDFKSLLAKLAEKYPDGSLEIYDKDWFEVTVVVDNFDFQNRLFFKKRYSNPAITAIGSENGLPGGDSITISFWFDNGRIWEKTTTGEKVTIRGKPHKYVTATDTVIFVDMLNCELVESTQTKTPTFNPDLIEAVKEANSGILHDEIENGKAFYLKGKVIKMLDPDSDGDFIFQSEDGLEFEVVTHDSPSDSIDQLNWHELKKGDEIELVGGSIGVKKGKDLLRWEFPIWASLFTDDAEAEK